jgi:hypothetical protein
MGHYTRVTQAIRRVEYQSGRKIKHVKRLLEQLNNA